MNLPKIEDLDLKGKRVIIRGDLDVKPDDDYRLYAMVPTLDYVSTRASSIVIFGHMGRPKEHGDKYSLKPIAKRFEEALINKWGTERVEGLDMQVAENLRFNAGELNNDEDYAKQLAGHGDIYINEAFSVSHRAHASIASLPKLLPHAAGKRFILEVENLEKIRSDPKRPLVMAISGIKSDKLSYVDKFLDMADKILIGGRLPEQVHDSSPLHRHPKVVVASLMADKEDITIRAMENFEKEIKSAGTIVVSGPLGKYEDEGHMQGTKRVLTAVADSNAFKVAGGGDTHSALVKLDLEDKFDWVSVGGGAMLDFLADGTLVGIEALK